MRAKVIAIESGSQFTDQRRRITLRFDGADSIHATVRFSERSLGIVGLKLDDQIDVTFGCDGAKIREERKMRQQSGQGQDRERQP